MIFQLQSTSVSILIYEVLHEIGVFNSSVSWDIDHDSWRITWIWGPSVREPIHDYLLREPRSHQEFEDSLTVLRAYAELKRI